MATYGDLSEFLHTNTLLHIDRKPMDNYGVSGFLVGLSETLVLLHLVDSSTLVLNGYLALRLSDISAAAPDNGFIHRFFAALNRFPIAPPFTPNLDTMGAFLASAQAHYPLVLIESEETDPDHLFIGRIVSQNAHTVRLYKVDSDGFWDEEKDFALSEITKAAAGDLYVEALALLLVHENNANPPA